MGRVNYPPIPFNANFALITPQILASSQRGPQVIMSDGTMWKVVGSSVTPRTLNTNVFGNVRAIPGPQSMVGTPDGSFVLVLAGNGSGYLYDAGIDDFVSGRTVIPAPIQGYFGPVAAGPNGQYYLANDQVLNAALTSVGSSSTGPVAGAVLAGAGGQGRWHPARWRQWRRSGPQSFARFSTPAARQCGGGGDGYGAGGSGGCEHPAGHGHLEFPGGAAGGGNRGRRVQSSAAGPWR